MRKIFLIWLSCCLLTINSQALAQEQQEQATPAPESAEKAAESTDKSATNSTSANSKADIKLPPSVIDLYKQDTKRELAAEIVTPMLAGAQDFITLTQPDMHSSDKGVAIILPDWHQSVTNPKAINFLRQHLPDDGWTSITVQPPEKPAGYPSQAESKTQQDTENEAALSAYLAQLTPMMQAVFDKAQNYPGIFLVIAEGNNAALLLNLFEQQQLPVPNAIVMLSAHLLTEKDNVNFAQKLSESDIPVLDLTLTQDNLWVEHFAPVRKKYVNKEMKTYYRQRQLISQMPGYYPERELSSSIKSWLAAIGW